ncbi:MAG: hypothetical protein U0K81_06555 [Paludibacteraceae bacterium]|nr:hypothetical protein [Paludibacteraceae bacterium]
MAKTTTERVITVNTREAENNIKSLREQIKSLSATQKELNIESEEFAEVSADLTAAQVKLRNAMQGNTAAVEGSYKAYSNQLQVLKEQRKWMAEGTEEYRKATEELAKLDAKLKEMDAQIGVHSRNVGNYSSAFYGLQGSVNQVTRELPVLTQGADRFFLAISNNIPILYDNIKAYKEMAKEGSANVSVLSALGKALFSWNTVITIGITLLTQFGDEIVDWVKNLFRAKDEVESLEETMRRTERTQEILTEAIERGDREIGQTIYLLKELSKQWEKLGEDVEGKEKFILDNADAFSRLGVSINSVYEAENLLITNTDRYIQALKARAQADAAKKIAEDNYSAAIALEFEQKRLLEYLQKIPAYMEWALEVDDFHGFEYWADERSAATRALWSTPGKIEEHKKAGDEAFAVALKLYEEAQGLLDDANITPPSWLEKAREYVKNLPKKSATTSSRVVPGEFSSSADRLSDPGLDRADAVTDTVAAMETERARLAALVAMEGATAKERAAIEANLQIELDAIEEARLTTHELVIREMLRDEELTAEERMTLEDELTKNQVEQTELRLEAEKRAEKEKEKLLEKRKKAEEAFGKAFSTILHNTSELMEEGSKEQKAIGAAAILFDTYQSAMAGFKSGMATAGPVLAAINVAAALSMGAVQLKNLLDVREDGSNAQSVNTNAPSVASSMPAAYTRNLMGDSELSELNKDMRVYVVESDITEAQNAAKARVESASF